MNRMSKMSVQIPVLRLVYLFALNTIFSIDFNQRLLKIRSYQEQPFFFSDYIFIRFTQTF